MKVARVKVARIVLLAALATALPALAADIGVVQKDQTFSKPEMTVAVGDTVLFGNADDVTHNISVKTPEGAEIDKGLQKHGEVIKQTFDSAGVYQIRCKIHPKMKMKITVK